MTEELPVMSDEDFAIAIDAPESTDGLTFVKNVITDTEAAGIERGMQEEAMHQAEIRYRTLGRPQATNSRTVEELEASGFQGLYELEGYYVVAGLLENVRVLSEARAAAVSQLTANLKENMAGRGSLGLSKWLADDNFGTECVRIENELNILNQLVDAAVSATTAEDVANFRTMVEATISHCDDLQRHRAGQNPQGSLLGCAVHYAATRGVEFAGRRLRNCLVDPATVVQPTEETVDATDEVQSDASLELVDGE